jgi:hypothetical protein
MKHIHLAEEAQYLLKRAHYVAGNLLAAFELLSTFAPPKQVEVVTEPPQKSGVLTIPMSVLLEAQEISKVERASHRKNKRIKRRRKDRKHVEIIYRKTLPMSA